mmetsp:Transcript_30409/g.71077  ORF Transcript_30409/g.71077 Transcript_30409/m.71077 type:complete len:162 (+) Transcript_30409:1817-2302(+)
MSTTVKSLPVHDDDDDDDSGSGNENDTTATHANFITLTQAYEVLQRQTSCGQIDKRFANHADDAEYNLQREREEAYYRAACEQRLGLEAEIVEECKASPLFLQWLSGRTDAAQTWRDFFVEHGGLGPKLRVYRDAHNNSGGQKCLPSTQVRLGPHRRRKRR